MSHSESTSPDVPPLLDQLPPLAMGGLRLATRFLLSPLAGFTNLPFRRVCRELGGVGLCTTDLVSARGLVARSPNSMRLIETCPDDRPFAVQIFGHDPAVMRDAARMLAEIGVDAIDINMGCPVDRITGGGAGSAMMCRPSDTVALVQTVVEAVTIPVTVKMRLGWDDVTITAPRFAREFEQVGVAAVSIHGRTREQGFRGSVSRAGIRQVVEAVERIPIVGNGDICTIADAARMFEETGCHAISIGRGALANPWIFRQLQQWSTTGSYDPSGRFDDRLALLRRQFAFLVEQAGTDLAISQFRKMGHWYLKSMRVKASLRHQFQQAKTRDEWDAAVAAIQVAGPSRHWRDGTLPDFHVPVPSGPVDKW